MKYLIVFFGIFVATSCLASDPELKISFYLVQKNEFSNSHYINTKDFPNLGYIANIPDVQFNKLKQVARASPEVWRQRDENNKVVASGLKQGISITFAESDAKVFLSFIHNAVGHRVLIVVGDHFLSAPIVMNEIQGDSMVINIPNKDSQEDYESELKKLMK